LCVCVCVCVCARACVWNSAVSTDLFLIRKEFLCVQEINIPYKCWKNICFSIWRCKFDTDLVRSSLVCVMYYFEIPVGGEDVDYYSSFLWDLHSLIPIYFIFLLYFCCVKHIYIYIYIYRERERESLSFIKTLFCNILINNIFFF